VSVTDAVDGHAAAQIQVRAPVSVIEATALTAGEHDGRGRVVAELNRARAL
jgi:hypothetical protein